MPGTHHTEKDYYIQAILCQRVPPCSHHKHNILLSLLSAEMPGVDYPVPTGATIPGLCHSHTIWRIYCAHHTSQCFFTDQLYADYILCPLYTFSMDYNLCPRLYIILCHHTQTIDSPYNTEVSPYILCHHFYIHYRGTMPPPKVLGTGYPVPTGTTIPGLYHAHTIWRISCAHHYT